jgi:hypothetical protein
MKKTEKLKELAKNPDLLEGIYNYCDRWCERCRFTKQCMVYLSEEENENNGSRDFADELGEYLEAAIELIQEKADELGIDLSQAMKEVEETEAELEEEERKIAQNILSEFSFKYAKDVEDWFKTNASHFEAYLSNLEEENELELPSKKHSVEAAHKISDAMEVIRWYQFFINVKISRALSNRTRFYDDEYSQEDINVSIKLAILAIENSMSAWYIIFENFPQLQDEVIDFMNNLNYLNRQLDEEFPGAREFKRPYFDD